MEKSAIAAGPSDPPCPATTGGAAPSGTVAGREKVSERERDVEEGRDCRDEEEAAPQTRRRSSSPNLEATGEG